MVQSWVIDMHPCYDPAQYLAMGRIGIDVRDYVADILIVLSAIHKRTSNIVSRCGRRSRE